MKMTFRTSSSLLIIAFASEAAQAALYDRGSGMIYDDILDITWLQDANYAYTSGYSTAVNGRMNWYEATNWVEQLAFGGYDDWRLASANLIDSANPCYSFDGLCDQGYNNATSELGHMFYNNLGNLSYYNTNAEGSQTGWGLTNMSFVDGLNGNSVSFSNIQEAYKYWVKEAYGPDTSHAWVFSFSDGFSGQTAKALGSANYSWAVRDGDISTVPIPSPVWLYGISLGLLGIIKNQQDSPVRNIRKP